MPLSVDQQGHFMLGSGGGDVSCIFEVEGTGADPMSVLDCVRAVVDIPRITARGRLPIRTGKGYKKASQTWPDRLIWQLQRLW